MKTLPRAVCLVVSSLALQAALAQPTVEWVARYNTSENGADEAHAIAVDKSGNVYVAGSCANAGTGSDYVTIKYSPAGIEQWVAQYNGPGNGGDAAVSIAIDTFGDVYVTGVSEGAGTDGDYATIKYNSGGVQQWVARYNGPESDYDEACALKLDDSGNVYVTGSSARRGGTGRDYATVKYNSAGAEQWVARYDGPDSGDDRASGLALDRSGNVHVTGVSKSSQISWVVDYATVKYNSAGVEQWVSRYNGPGDYWDEAKAITVDNSGNVYVTGVSNGTSASLDYATVKYNSAGVEQWAVYYDDPDNLADQANAIVVDDSGNVYVTGVSTLLATGLGYATVKYSSAGVEQWVARHTGEEAWRDEARAIALDDSGNVYVTGWSNGTGTVWDYGTIRYSPAGVQQWIAFYNNAAANGYDQAEAIALDGSGNVYVTGCSWGHGTDYDIATVKYSQRSAGVVEPPFGERKGALALHLLQNPVRGALAVWYALPTGQTGTLSILDATGRLVESRILSANGSRLTPNVPSAHASRLTANVPPGVYFVRLTAGTRSATAKVVKIE